MGDWPLFCAFGSTCSSCILQTVPVFRMRSVLYSLTPGITVVHKIRPYGMAQEIGTLLITETGRYENVTVQAHTQCMIVGDVEPEFLPIVLT